MPGPKKGNAASIEAGRRGAVRRWNGRRIVRLDTLDSTVRAVILHLVEVSERIAREKAAAVVSETSIAAAMEDDGASRRLPPAA